MRKLMLVMIAVQMAAIGVALAAALVEIETIVVSGMLLSGFGAAIAVLGFACIFRRTLYFGFSVPTISIVCLAIINGFSWGPHAARIPVGSILVAFALASLPLGLAALREINLEPPAPMRRLQFRLSSMLGLMLVFSLPLALYRLGPAAGALGVLLGYSILLAYTLHHFHAKRSFGHTFDSHGAPVTDKHGVANMNEWQRAWFLDQWN